MRVRLLSVFLLLLLITPAWSQTAEETVLFLMTGREVDPDTKVDLIGQCVYRLTLAPPEFRGTYVQIDFNKLSEYEITAIAPPDQTLIGHTILLKGVEGLVYLWAIGPASQGSQMLGSYKKELDGDIAATAQPERIMAALRYFRTTFCKGRAF